MMRRSTKWYLIKVCGIVSTLSFLCYFMQNQGIIFDTQTDRANIRDKTIVIEPEEVPASDKMVNEMLNVFGNLGLHRANYSDKFVGKISENIVESAVDLIRNLPDRDDFSDSNFTVPFYRQRNYLISFIGENSLKYQFFNLPRYICSKEHVDLIVLVAADPNKFERRDVIRETWGSVRESSGLTISVVFILGYREEDKELQRQIQAEINKYGDILQGNFMDSYETILIKHLYGYRWAAEYCSYSTYTLKTYDDIFVNILKVAYFLKTKMPSLPQRTIAGAEIKTEPKMVRVNRGGKYQLAIEQYPYAEYPPFNSGTITLMRTVLSTQLSLLSNVIRPFWVEDVWLTGLLPLYLDTTFYKLKTAILKTSCNQTLPKLNLTESHAVKSNMHDWGSCKTHDAPAVFLKNNWLQLTGAVELEPTLDVRIINLTKAPKHSLGFSLKGGRGSPGGDGAIYVKAIFTEGPAVTEGSLKNGDKILSVNGKSLQGMTLEEVMMLIRSTKPGNVKLSVG